MNNNYAEHWNPRCSCEHRCLWAVAGGPPNVDCQQIFNRFFLWKKKSNKLTEWRKSNKTLLTEWLRAVISIKINICALRTYRRRTCNAREVSTRIGFRWRPFKTKIFINMVSMEMLLGGLFKWLMHLALCCFLCFYCQCCFFYLSLPWPVTYAFKKLHSMLSFYFVLFIFRRHVKQISAELRLCTKTHEGDRRPGSLHTISPGIELLTTFTLHLTFHLEISSALISGFNIFNAPRIQNLPAALVFAYQFPNLNVYNLYPLPRVPAPPLDHSMSFTDA